MTDFQNTVADYADRQAAFMKNVAEQIEQAKEGYERRGMVSTSVTPEQLERKLKRANSPMIVSQGWSGSAPVGGTIDYSVGISNPDPVDYSSLFVHLFIGPANIAPDVDDAVAAVDERFPRLTNPQFAGLVLKAGSFEQINFIIPIPVLDNANIWGTHFCSSPHGTTRRPTSIAACLFSR